MEEVQNDPWSASKCHSSADRLEELQEGGGAGGGDMSLEDVIGEGGGAALMGHVQDRSNAVVVIDSVGTMVMVNKVSWAGNGGCELDSGLMGMPTRLCLPLSETCGC